MEFTKDLMFHIKYEQDDCVMKINKETREKKGILHKIKTHKFFSTMCLAAIVLISADIVLINNFINLLKQF